MSDQLPENPSGQPPAPRPVARGELPGMAADELRDRRVGFGGAVPGGFSPRAAVPTAHPRKVKNGIKLLSRSGPVTTAWAGQRWLRLVEDFSSQGAAAEGLVYARSGQARALNIAAGHIHSSVQGRMPYPYTVDIRLPVIRPEQWAAVLDAMTGEARHVAGLLGGEVPSNIEDLFLPLHLRLFPLEVSDLAVSCSCGQCEPPGMSRIDPADPSSPPAKPLFGGWCKHVACVMTLVAERLGNDTFLIFALRGIQRDELLEQLRARRSRQAGARAAESGEAAVPADTRPVPVYLPRLAGADEASSPLEQSIDHFWAVGPGLHQIELSMQQPDVSHPLLRRLGPSPFDAAAGAKFPLVGLLATCYDVVTQHALEEERARIAAEAGK
ncbi:MAG TPA: hypothetical protein VEB22_10415 [Phycisphaerales bacterium]|nr:hypothetical protein [Phycisphaerales bacterium]